MTAEAIAALFGVWVIAVASPGPDLAIVLQRALTGRRRGLAAALGVVAGIAVWIVAAFAGLATVLRVQPGLMTGLQVAGGLLLATVGVLGVQGWLRARRKQRAELASPPAESRPATTTPAATTPATTTPATTPDPPAARQRVRGDLFRGLATNLSNPKALVFFGAILAPFLSAADKAGVGLSPLPAVALVTGMVAVALVWFCGLAVAASHPRVHSRIGRWLPWIDVAVSVVFVVVGVAFVITALASR